MTKNPSKNSSFCYFATFKEFLAINQTIFNILQNCLLDYQWYNARKWQRAFNSTTEKRSVNKKVLVVVV